MKKLIFLLLLPLSIYGQHYVNKSDGNRLCLEIGGDNFDSDLKTEHILDNILSVIGVSRMFILVQCDGIKNANATTIDGIRYILYDKNFFNSTNEDNYWIQIFILSHEIGHHLRGHNTEIFSESFIIDNEDNRERNELEADEFSGFILGKLGANLNKDALLLNSIIKILDFRPIGSIPISNYPSTNSRINAIKNGYNKAIENSPFIEEFDELELSNLELYYRGREKISKQEFVAAIEDFSMTIENDPTFSLAYLARGMVLYYLNDHKAAIKDLSRAIELNPTSETSFLIRGQSKYALEDYEGANVDFTKAIELKSDNPETFSLRGQVRYDMQDYSNALLDFSTAISLEANNWEFFFNRGVIKKDMFDFSGCVDDATEAISLNPEFADSFYNRGFCKFSTGNYAASIIDYSIAIELDPLNSDYYFSRGNSKYDSKDYAGALEDYSKVIELDDKNVDAYINSAWCKGLLKDYVGAISDCSIALSLDPYSANAYYNRAIQKYYYNDKTGACEDANNAERLGADARDFLESVCE